MAAMRTATRTLRERCAPSCELSRKSSARMFGGNVFATARQLPGNRAEVAQDTLPDVLPDGSRTLRDRLAGYR